MRFAVGALAALLVAVTAFPAVAQVDPNDPDKPFLIFELRLRNHRFHPDRIIVPAFTPFRLRVKNADKTPQLFESPDLNIRGTIEPGKNITFRLPPQDAQEYKFYGKEQGKDATALGLLQAK